MVGGGWGLQSHFIVKPNLVLRLRWGFDNCDISYIRDISGISSIFDISDILGILGSKTPGPKWLDQKRINQKQGLRQSNMRTGQGFK